MVPGPEMGLKVGSALQPTSWKSSINKQISNDILNGAQCDCQMNSRSATLLKSSHGTFPEKKF